MGHIGGRDDGGCGSGRLLVGEERFIDGRGVLVAGRWMEGANAGRGRLIAGVGMFMAGRGCVGGKTILVAGSADRMYAPVLVSGGVNLGEGMSLRVAGVLAGVDADKGCYCRVRGGVAGRKMPAGPLTRPREKKGKSDTEKDTEGIQKKDTEKMCGGIDSRLVFVYI